MSEVIYYKPNSFYCQHGQEGLPQKATSLSFVPGLQGDTVESL